MKIERIEINHLLHPLGYQLTKQLHIVAFLDETVQVESLKRRLVIKNDEVDVINTNFEEADNLIFDVEADLLPRTRYSVEVDLEINGQNIHGSTYFETGYQGEELKGSWIGTDQNGLHSIILSKKFETKQVSQARLYITGVGLFEAYIDGEKIGDEFLTPGFTDYNYYVQLETYDVTKNLTEGEHELSVMLADGWYRGKIGLKEHGGIPNVYGTDLKAIADLCFVENGQKHIIKTDDSWQVLASPVTHSGIYYGEDLDDTRRKEILGSAVIKKSPAKYVKDRMSLPIKRHEVFAPKVIITSSGDEVLDFGQNMAGWLEFKNTIPAGEKVSVEFGEIMQDGEFYRDNLRSARAQFTYVSDGQNKWIRPHFTYFGFRYVKLNDFPKINPDDFRAVSLYSDMRETGQIQTDNKDVNRLFENVKWGQKSNFMDIPTDCPQRDERMGWTGDAEIFAQTASYNMDTYQFFKKYSYDIAVEQSKNNGFVPLYVPAADQTDGGKAVWSDAATIIPWVSYKRSGDKAILHQNIGAMMSWVDWVHDRAINEGHEYLWLGDDQLGDWLALDTEDIMKLKGKTPDDLIASAYYYYSAKIVSESARLLDMKHEYQYYRQLAKLIKEAFIKHFFTEDGLSIADTQTGIALCLVFGLYPENGKEKLTQKLVKKIEQNKNHLDTGFVGTPLLLTALSDNGQDSLALRLFLNTDFPSWIYEVKHGATTIWERWNSVDENGHIAKNGMNSLNHYSSGAVMSWAYESLLGIRQDGINAVFKPLLSSRFRKISGQAELPTGLIKVQWQIESARRVVFTLAVPLGSKVKLVLPKGDFLINGQKRSTILTSGMYNIEFTPLQPLVESWDVHTPLNEFVEQKDLTDKLQKLVPFWGFLTLPGNLKHFGQYSLFQLSQEMRSIGFKPFEKDDIEKINKLFKEYAMEQGNAEEALAG